MKILKVKLADRIEKIRASDNTIVCLEVEYQDHGETYTRIGISSIPGQPYDQAIKRGRDQAIEDAVGSQLFPLKIILSCGAIGGKALIKNAKDNDNKKLLEELEAPCNDGHQKVLDDICVELGISKISLENYNLATFYCIKAALTDILNQTGDR